MAGSRLLTLRHNQRCYAQAGCHVFGLTYIWLVMAAALSLLQCDTIAKQGQAGPCTAVAGRGAHPKVHQLARRVVASNPSTQSRHCWLIEGHPQLAAAPCSGREMCVSGQGLSFWRRKQDCSSLDDTLQAAECDSWLEAQYPQRSHRRIFNNLVLSTSAACSIIAIQQAKFLGKSTPRGRARC